MSAVCLGRVCRDPFNGLENGSEPVEIQRFGQLGEIFRCDDGIEFGSLTLFETDFLAKRIWYNQNIAKQYRRIEAEAPDGLQGGFRRESWGVAKI